MWIICVFDNYTVIFITFMNKQSWLTANHFYLKAVVKQSSSNIKLDLISFQKYGSFLSTMPDCGHCASAYVCSRGIGTCCPRKQL